MKQRVMTLKIILAVLIAAYAAVMCLFDLGTVTLEYGEVYTILPYDGLTGTVIQTIKLNNWMSMFIAVAAVVEICLAVLVKKPSKISIAMCILRVWAVFMLIVISFIMDALLDTPMTLYPVIFACAVLGLAAIVVYSLLKTATASPSQLISKESEQQ